MDHDTPPAPITADQWAATPLVLRQFIGAPLTIQTDYHHLILQLQQQNADLPQRLTDLEARLKQQSQNSSKPPSSDAPSAPPRRARVPRGRKAGGQIGHPDHERPDPDPDHIDYLRDHYPDVCPTCQFPLAEVRRDACAVQTQYVCELPIVRPHITAHHYHTVCCLGCGVLVTADRPPNVPKGGTQRLPGPAHRRQRDNPARRLSSQSSHSAPAAV